MTTAIMNYTNMGDFTTALALGIILLLISLLLNAGVALLHWGWSDEIPLHHQDLRQPQGAGYTRLGAGRGRHPRRHWQQWQRQVHPGKDIGWRFKTGWRRSALAGRVGYMPQRSIPSG